MASWHGRLAALLAALAAVAGTAEGSTTPVRVGSKSFTESYVIAEIAARIIEQVSEASVERRFGLGGTGIVYRALASGEIDVYPEYTGTISRAILNDPSVTDLPGLRARMRPRGLVISEPLGFANTYALAVRRDTAARLGLRSISDLGRHPGLAAAFDPGFLDRDDGWPGLQRHYGLRLAAVRGMEHALTYPALTSGRVDVIDVFSTDGQLARADLVLLADDRHFFPDYAAVLLARASLADRLPRTWAALQQRLAGRIDNATMARLNAEVELDRRTFAQAAAAFLGEREARSGSDTAGRHLARDLVTLTVEHLVLVGVSLAVAIALGVPLGLLAARHRLFGQIELMGIGVLQTIPALALLAFMIPLFGIGRVPALVALCLYALLPIVRNAYAGVSSLDPQLLDMAAVMRVSAWQRLAWIELPLAAVTIMAGIKTAAVLTVGTATLAAFIGGGGYGTLIVTGLALNDVPTILAGAIPAALMALAIHAGFEALDRLVVPRPLRGSPGRVR
ncbi:MAG TPA: glycine betaine ABC transporter substrate-binding protein [Methylomirabilota bacterium]|nr:glycine betaine ABC transporter substrate-binding protein [Methylomirabilota bacterium]